MSNTYYLMHGNSPAAVIKDSAITGIFDKAELPLGIISHGTNSGNYPDSEYLMNHKFHSWLDHRTIPNNRVFGELLQKALGCSFPEAMLRSMAISLTDTYWLKPEGTDFRWEDMNFHDNLFSNAVNDVVLSHQGSIPSDMIHPTFTTDGLLEKTWFILNGRPFLLKFDDTHEKQQLVGEVYASRVADMLGVSHVPYHPVTIGNRQGVVCPCIVNDSHTDMTYAMQYKWDRRLCSPELYHTLHDQDPQGMERFVAFDALTMQTDRHEYNFAFDSDGKLLPLYDSGRCLCPDDYAKPFHHSHKEQLELLTGLPFQLPDQKLLVDIYKDTCDSFHVPPKQEALQAIQNGYELMVKKEKEEKKEEIYGQSSMDERE